MAIRRPVFDSDAKRVVGHQSSPGEAKLGCHGGLPGSGPADDRDRVTRELHRACVEHRLAADAENEGDQVARQEQRYELGIGFRREVDGDPSPVRRDLELAQRGESGDVAGGVADDPVLEPGEFEVDEWLAGWRLVWNIPLISSSDFEVDLGARLIRRSPGQREFGADTQAVEPVAARS